MNKDNYRDYVADAFRYYALCGKPSANDMQRARTKNPPSDPATRGRFNDLDAVVRVLDRIQYEADCNGLAKCLDVVYFANPKRSATRGALTARVRLVAVALAVSESTVYRMLRRLRMMYALERGLRVDEKCVPITI